MSFQIPNCGVGFMLEEKLKKKKLKLLFNSVKPIQNLKSKITHHISNFWILIL